MNETQETSVLTPEQQQRLLAIDNAARFLRSSNGAFAGGPADHKDIIDLAHYIVTGTPYSIAHKHEHDLNDRTVGGVIELDPDTAGRVHDLLTSVFGADVKKDEQEAVDFDFDDDL